MKYYQRFNEKLFFSVELVIVVVLCFYLGQFVSYGAKYIAALWTGISGIIVLQSSRKITKQMAIMRFWGTLIGSIIPGIILLFFPPNITTIVITIFLASLICRLFNLEDIVRTAALTSLVIIIVSMSNPNIPSSINALFRFLDSILGTIIAVFTRKISLYIIVNYYKVKHYLHKY